MFRRHFAVLLLLGLLLSGCGGLSAPAPITANTFTPEAENLTAADGFPVHTHLRYARAFTVEYRESYKVLTVLKPWRGAEVTFTYILVQRGTPAPQNTGDAQVIEVPVRSLASLATTHLPYLEKLDDLDSLVAIGNAQYVNTPGVAARLQAGSLKAAGNGPDVNLEILLETNPEMITTFALGSSGKDDYRLLMQKGFNVVVFSDYMEESPLGRAEWIKFMALFFNQEEEAERIFSGIEQRYNEVAALAAGVTERPTVLLGFEINGNWNVPGGNSYQAAYVKDAGGNYLWADEESAGRIPMSFEAVYARGRAADFWFDQSVSWQTGADVLAADVRYQNFAAFAPGRVYNNNARLNPTGGNDYNESGLVNPDLVLADLVSILHPYLLAEHELVYYRPLLDEGE